jgi:protein phosphatase 1L
VHMLCEQNGREYMEDRLLVAYDPRALYEHLPQDRRTLFVGVYDGHAGGEASAYLQAHLHHAILSDPALGAALSNDAGVACAGGGGAGADQVLEVLRRQTVEMDRVVCARKDTHQLKSGATCLVALLCGCELYLANVGDSRGFLCRSGRVDKMVAIHTPSDPGEKERVKAAGGMVLKVYGSWRVNGTFAVSRSVGDPAAAHLVIAEPALAHLTLCAGDHFLVLATDGLWDVVSEQQVAVEVYRWLQAVADDEDDEDITQILYDLAVDGRSSDNITIVVVLLDREAATSFAPLYLKKHARKEAKHEAAQSKLTE